MSSPRSHVRGRRAKQSSAPNRLFWSLYPSQRNDPLHFREETPALRHLIHFPNSSNAAHSPRSSRCNSCITKIPFPPLFFSFSFFLSRSLIHTSGSWVKLFIFCIAALACSPSLVYASQSNMHSLVWEMTWVPRDACASGPSSPEDAHVL